MIEGIKMTASSFFNLDSRSGTGDCKVLGVSNHVFFQRFTDLPV
ncbi:MAG: hypothetical protein ACR5K4_02905 [Sodalis sp. (in: enterobacteria)]